MTPTVLEALERLRERLEEGRSFPVGTRRTWKRGEMEKRSEGWRRTKAAESPSSVESPMDRLKALQSELSPDDTELTKQLKFMSAMMAGQAAPGMKYGSFYEAILKEREPMPESRKMPPEVLDEVFADISEIMPEPKQCFYNAQKLVLNNPEKYEYVEGYVMSRFPMPIHHGWVIFRHKGKRYLVDPTLRSDHDDGFTQENLAIGEIPEDREYLGRSFPSKLIFQRWKTGMAGSLYEWPPLYPLMQKNPDWKVVQSTPALNFGD